MSEFDIQQITVIYWERDLFRKLTKLSILVVTQSLKIVEIHCHHFDLVQPFNNNIADVFQLRFILTNLHNVENWILRG